MKDLATQFNLSALALSASLLSAGGNRASVVTAIMQFVVSVSPDVSSSVYYEVAREFFNGNVFPQMSNVGQSTMASALAMLQAGVTGMFYNSFLDLVAFVLCTGLLPDLTTIKDPRFVPFLAFAKKRLTEGRDTTLEHIGEVLMYFTSHAYAMVTGDKDSFLSNYETYESFPKTVADFIRRATLQDLENKTSIADLLSECKRLLAILEQLRLSERSMRMCLDKTIVGRLQSQLDSVYAGLLLRRTTAELQRVPYSVLIVGATAIGKSTAARIVICAIADYFKFKPGDGTVWNVPAGSKYDDGFNGSQRIAVFDDVDLVLPDVAQDASAPLVQIIRIVNNVSTISTQADVTEKGRYTLSFDGVVLTGNNPSFGSEKILALPVVLMRRIRVMVLPIVLEEMRRNPNSAQLDPSAVKEKAIDKMRVHCYRVMRVCVVAGPGGQDEARVYPAHQYDLTLEEFQDFLRTDIKSHNDDQISLINANSDYSERPLCPECSLRMGPGHACPVPVPECEPTRGMDLKSFKASFTDVTIRRQMHTCEVRDSFTFYLFVITLGQYIFAFFALYSMRKTWLEFDLVRYVLDTYAHPWAWPLFALFYRTRVYVRQRLLDDKTDYHLCLVRMKELAQSKFAPYKHRRTALIVAAVAAIITAIAVYKRSQKKAIVTPDPSTYLDRSSLSKQMLTTMPKATGIMVHRGAPPGAWDHSKANLYKEARGVAGATIEQVSRLFADSMYWGEITSGVGSHCGTICCVGGNRHVCVMHQSVELDQSKPLLVRWRCQNGEWSPRKTVLPTAWKKTKADVLLFLIDDKNYGRDLTKFFLPSSLTPVRDGMFDFVGPDAFEGPIKITRTQGRPAPEMYYDVEDPVALREAIEYTLDTQTFSGQCGNILIYSGSGSGYKTDRVHVAGIHIGGCGNRGISSFLSVEDVTYPFPDHPLPPVKPQCGLVVDPLSKGWQPVNLDKKSSFRSLDMSTTDIIGTILNYPRSSSETTYVDSAFGKVYSFTGLCPAFLSKGWRYDPNAPVNPETGDPYLFYIDPSLHSLKARTCRPRELDFKLLWAVAVSVAEHQYTDIDLSSMGSMSEHNAINGIPGTSHTALKMGKSSGFPCNTSKRSLMEGDVGCYIPGAKLRLLQDDFYRSLNEGPPAIVVNTFMKDEILSLEKALNGRTRVVSAFPTESIIASNRLFGTLLMYNFDNCRAARHGGGINCMSPDWDELWKSLEFANVIAGDYVSYDSGRSQVEMRVVWAAALKVLRTKPGFSEAYPEENVEMMTNLSDAESNVFANYNGDVLITPGTQPSGSRSTFDRNNMMNLHLLGLAFVSLGIEQGLQVAYLLREFNKLFIIVFGDDHVVDAGPFHWYNQNSIKGFFGRFGIGYTDALKQEVFPDYLPAKDLVFLKRSFVPDPELGVCRAPLPFKSILKALCVYKSDCGLGVGEHAVEMRLNCARELAQHGKAFYDLQSPTLDEAFLATGMPPLPSYDEQWSDMLPRFYTCERLHPPGRFSREGNPAS